MVPSKPRSRPEGRISYGSRRNVDVGVGEVAGPDGVAAVANADVGAKAHLVALKVLGRPLFGVPLAEPAALGALLVTDPEAQPVAFRRFAGPFRRPLPAGPSSRPPPRGRRAGSRRPGADRESSRGQGERSVVTCSRRGSRQGGRCSGGGGRRTGGRDCTTGPDTSRFRLPVAPVRRRTAWWRRGPRSVRRKKGSNRNLSVRCGLRCHWTRQVSPQDVRRSSP